MQAGAGALPHDVAHVLGGVMLLLSFGMLCGRRAGAAITLYAAQASVLAVAAAWQGWMQDSAQLYLVALVTLAAKGVAIPRALRRLNMEDTGGPGVFPTMALGVALVGLAALVALPTAIDSRTMTREDLSTALSVVLLGLLALTTRRSAPGGVIGLLSVENGLMLAAVELDGMPLVATLALASLGLLAGALFGLFVLRTPRPDAAR